MTRSLPNPLLAELSEFITARMGLHFPQERWPELERGIRAVARDLGYADAEECLRRLPEAKLTREQVSVLAGQLTVGETYFFREKQSFQGLHDHILPGLIQSRRAQNRPLRLWSAGCCTGEEPYSLAMLLRQAGVGLTDSSLTILATDINPRFLQKAGAGLYSDWSFRDNPPWIKENYFEKTPHGRWKIQPELKAMVQFRCLNLVEDSYPSLLNQTNAMDVIFCRNVLMYFAPRQARRVVDNLFGSLVEGGWLVVSPTEASLELLSAFVRVDLGGAVFYRKPTQAERLNGEQMSFVASPPARFLDSGGSERHPQEERPLGKDVAEEWLRAEPLATPSLPIDQEPAVSELPAFYQDAFALFEQGRYVEAAAQLAAGPPAETWAPKVLALRARIHANQGQLAEARAWCEQAIAADKLNPGWHYLRAIICEELGDDSAGQQALEHALFLDPKFVLAHFALANLARRQGKRQKVDKHLNNTRSLLRTYQPQDVLPESDGLTAGRLLEIVDTPTKRASERGRSRPLDERRSLGTGGSEDPRSYPSSD